MPRYHFVVREPDHTHDDPDGVHLPNHDAAKDHGDRIVRELKEDGYHPGNAALDIRRDRTESALDSVLSEFARTNSESLMSALGRGHSSNSCRCSLLPKRTFVTMLLAHFVRDRRYQWQEGHVDGRSDL